MATITTVKERINQLNQASFQILCDALLAKEGYPGIVALGTKDGAEKTTQGTPDTYFCKNGGRYVFAEYTTQKKELPKKISSDINKCLNEEYTKIPLSEIVEIVYCHTSSNIKPADDRELKSRCEAKGIKLTLIGIDLLAEMLMNYPIIIKDHLGISIDSEQIQDAGTFVKQYNSYSMAATLETAFLFREKEIDAIDKSFENVSTVLLVGSAGTGKTRLALEYAKRHAAIHNEMLLCVHDRSLPMYEDLKFYFEKPGNYFVFIDDANQLTELEHIIEYVNKADSGYNVHILMTVRDYAVPKVKADINGIIYYDVIKINPFSDEEITTLMKNHYGIQNTYFLERIVQIAEGNARIAMLTGKIACDKNSLDAINDVSDLYQNYYGKALQELGVASNIKLLVSAGIMAFLNAIHLDHIDSIIPILEEKSITIEDFKHNLHILHENEIVDICNDKGVRFSEQCMSNFVLKYVFFDKKVIKLSSMIEACFMPYCERTINAVKTLFSVFRISELQDYVKGEILDLWKKLENENSPVFYDFFKAFYLVDEIKALLIVQNYVEKEETVIINAEDIDTKAGKNYKSVSDDIINILGGFSSSKNIDAAVDLFFQYYLKRPDLYIQFYHAATSSFSIEKDSYVYGYKTQIEFFSKMIEYSQNGDNQLIDILFLDVANHFLQLEFSPWESTRNGKGIEICQMSIALTSGVAEYRKLIWTHLLVLASKSLYSKWIKDILRGYGYISHDCSKEVIVSEASYICRLSKLLLSPECLDDCLIAQSLQRVFEDAGYGTNDLTKFLKSEKYKLYQLINGPKWSSEISYDEREKKKRDNIQKYMLNAVDKTSAFKKILYLYFDSITLSNRDSYELSGGINIALQSLANSKDDYVSCVKMILSSKASMDFNTFNVVANLFTFLTPSEVLDLLTDSHESQRNAWMFAYYHEIPQELIDNKELQGLYDFLVDESDRNIRLSAYRDIGFLDKYLTIDKDVILKASRLILKKREYSPFIVTLYFNLQFNKVNISTKDVIQKFTRDIKLLEQIYLCVAECGNLADHNGAFLHELFQVDKPFVTEYAKWFVLNEADHKSRDNKPEVDVFYQEENYIEILDYIVEMSILTLNSPSFSVPQIIKKLITHKDSKKYIKKTDVWIKHQIECFCMNKDRMSYLFDALTKISVEYAYKYIPVLISATDNYDVFESISLTPSSYSWSGSRVPLYSLWVDKLEQLLPLFSGLKYIKHKSRVQQLIESFRRRIKEEEISDIING